MIERTENASQSPESSPTNDSSSLVQELHLKIYSDRAELALSDGRTETFHEGVMSEQARERYSSIQQALKQGFLRDQIALCRQKPDLVGPNDLGEQQRYQLDAFIQLLTSEVGRALIALMVLQLCIKSIEPDQTIRLHKGGRSRKDFSWKEGISMRSIDNTFITPLLRTEGLLNVNKDGIFMTRSLAENYPYSQFYKAAVRGARAEWLTIVEELESGVMKPLPALRYLLSQILNRAAQFEALATDTLKKLSDAHQDGRLQDRISVEEFIVRHMNTSSYAARLMEISMHALMQALQDSNNLGDASLVPLSQMRNANKKHGNIGDIELKEDGLLVESWDAKFGKSYLRDELEELSDKLNLHENVAVAGFVTSDTPDMRHEISVRMTEIEDVHATSIRILALDQWTKEQFDRATQSNDESFIARGWLQAYVESLAQKRKDLAPIDEPCFAWLQALHTMLSEE